MTMTQKEKEIAKYMATLKITYEEAKQLWEDDNSDEVLPEVKAMEAKGKENGGKRRYEKSGNPRKPSTRERKVDETKKELIGAVEKVIAEMGASDIAVQTETELKFTYAGESYTFKLTKHRTAK